MVAAVVIPDAIEPVVGWRSFVLRDQMLVSPQQGHVWLPGAKAEARCRVAFTEFRWMQVSQEQVLLEMAKTSCVAAHVVSSKLGHFMTVRSGTFPPMPATEPDEGMAWSLEPCLLENHPAPADDCNCGIHIAKSIPLALQYLMGGVVFGRVALWGKVIEGEHGYRGEFAYPTELYVFDEIEVADFEALHRYGVPLKSARENVEWQELERQGYVSNLGSQRYVMHVPLPVSRKPLSKGFRAFAWVYFLLMIFLTALNVYLGQRHNDLFSFAAAIMALLTARIAIGWIRR